jgi:hypothetical protein
MKRLAVCLCREAFTFRRKRMETLYMGRYSLEVPEGQKVRIVFSQGRSDGTLQPITVVKFARDTSGFNEALQFRVTRQVPGRGRHMNLGNINVGEPFATPAGGNPLADVDSDGDGIGRWQMTMLTGTAASMRRRAMTTNNGSAARDGKTEAPHRKSDGIVEKDIEKTSISRTA